jgi:hypothetical protein
MFRPRHQIYKNIFHRNPFSKQPVTLKSGAGEGKQKCLFLHALQGKTIKKYVDFVN